jgi:hypothetical protein
MKQCDLQTIYSDLALQIPTETGGYESITLSSENLPLPPFKMESGNLYIVKTKHNYNNWFETDLLWFYARKETYRYLGLLILSVVFHQRVPKVEIKLSHSHSEIKNLIVEYAPRNINKLPSGYHTQPFAFEYYAQLTAKHPFDRCVLPKDLPCFELSNSKGLSFTDEDWKQRDTVKIFGSDIGLVAFAELLLNFSVPHNDLDEIQLEGESGFRGVGVSSAELSLFLPGHLAWTEEHWQEGL